MEQAHGRRCPNHGNHAFGDHHAVEDFAAVGFVFSSARNDWRLCGVEAGKRTAGDGQEQQREDRCVIRVHVLERELRDRRARDDQANADASGAKQQQRAEVGINTPNHFINRQQRGNQVVGKNRQDDQCQR